MRTFLASLLLGVGYLLVYAAVKGAGEHALAPWEALRD
jgi:hypothetical protein